MLTELSLNVLDIAQNSISANASLIEICVNVSEEKDIIEITIKDDGRGMTKEQLEQVCDPFFTTRTTRSVGLGTSFFKQAAEMSDGEFKIDSEPGVGTKVFASFKLSHIDRMPLGDISDTIHNLVVYNEGIDFIYTYTFNDKSFTLNTKQIREMLGDIPFNTPDVSDFIKGYLIENKEDTDGGKII